MAESIGGRNSIANIPTADVKEALLRTMVMGMASAAVDRPTFYFDGEQTYDPDDTEGSPWDWTQTPVTDTSADPIQVLCAYEFYSPLGRQGSFQTEVGEFNPTTVVVTMFREQFDAVYGFTYMKIGPSQQDWYFRHHKPGVALNDMDVYQITCVATGRD